MRFAWLLTAFLLSPLAASAQHWPSWRGPNFMGVSDEVGLPVTWSNTEGLRWKIPLEGAGVSTPVAWGDRIFLTASTGRNNDRLHVYCYHRMNGRLLWHTPLLGSMPTDLFPPGGMAVPSAATDGKRVFVLFGTGDLAALDLDGSPVWIRSLAQEYGPFRNRWGMGSSPLLVNERLIVQVDHWSQSYLLAIDPETGKNSWKSDRTESVNWTSPCPVTVNGKTQIVTFGTEHARGYDLQTGKQLWVAKGMHFQCIPSPVFSSGSLIATSGVSSFALRLDGAAGDVTSSHVLWTNKKANAFLPSPVAYRDLIFLPADRGFVTCLDPKKGTQVWKERLEGSYHASPVAADGKVYVASKEGTVYVLEATREFSLLAENRMGETIIASPAIASGDILLRGDRHLFCVRGKK